MPAAHGVLMMGKVNSHSAKPVTLNDQQQNNFNVSREANLDCCSLTQSTWMCWLREVLSAQSYQLCLAKLLSALHKHEQ